MGPLPGWNLSAIRLRLAGLVLRWDASLHVDDAVLRPSLRR
jgi:hypothetical protein